jgi:hypothetical protein
MDQLVFNVLPDDPGHLVAVHFDDWINHFDFRHGEKDPCSAEWMGKAIGTVRGRWVRPLRRRRRYSTRAAAVKGVAVIPGHCPFVIPGPSQRARPEVAGPMTGFARSRESIIAAVADEVSNLSRTSTFVVMDSGFAAFSRAPE